MAPPVLPRAEILADLKTAMLAISGGPNWNYQVTTVQVGQEITRNFGLSQLPLIMIDPKMTDTEDRVTFGDSTANRHHRRWPIEITGIVKPSSDLDIRAEGERFLSDIVKKLLTMTIVLASGQQAIVILRQLMGPDNFERSEHKTAVVGVDIDISYLFSPRDL